MGKTNNTEENAIQGIEFSDHVYKEAVNLAAYYYIKKLHEIDLISEYELRKIREKYHIRVE